MTIHPAIDDEHLDRCAVWEENGEITGVAHYEFTLGEAFFLVAPGRRDPKQEMLDYAEARMRGTVDDGEYLAAYCGDADHAFAAELARRGFDHEGEPDGDRSRLPPARTGARGGARGSAARATGRPRSTSASRALAAGRRRGRSRHPSSRGSIRP